MTLRGLLGLDHAVSGVAQSPAGGTWTSARVVARRTRDTVRASDMGPRLVRGVLRHVLELEGEEGHAVVLVEAGPWDARGLRALRRTRWKLRFAPDDHALALSPGGDAPWSVVALDGPVPMHCPHVAMASPWEDAPTTRELVLEILSSSTSPGQARDRSHAGPPWEHVGAADTERRLDALERGFLQELRAAMTYALAHRRDPDLRGALTRCLIDPGEQLRRDLEPALDGVADLAREYLDVRSLLVEGLDGPRSERATLALAHCGDPQERAHLAAHLGRVGASRPSEAAVVAWALARAAREDGALEPEAVEALAALAGAEPTSPTLGTAQRLAVLALGWAGAEEPLRGLALLPCHALGPGGGVLSRGRVPPWPDEVQALELELLEDQGAWANAGCWARAALARP